MLHNSLPISLYVLTCGTTEELVVQPGDSTVLPTVEPGVSCVVFKVEIPITNQANNSLRMFIFPLVEELWPEIGRARKI